MKVKELIGELIKWDPEQEVGFANMQNSYMGGGFWSSKMKVEYCRVGYIDGKQHRVDGVPSAIYKLSVSRVKRES